MYERSQVLAGILAFVSRLESGVCTRPPLSTIEQYADAAGALVEIRVRLRRQLPARALKPDAKSYVRCGSIATIRRHEAAAGQAPSFV
jgi:hypothetical protein